MMEETTSTTPKNNTVMIALIAVIVLLAAVIGYIVLNDGGDKTASAPAADTSAPAATAPATPGMPGSTPEAEFDPATAVKVAEGVTPEQHVTKYFDAVLAGDYAGAYAMLPTSKQASYGSVESFSEQLTGYGMTEYTIDSAVEEGEEAQVKATAVMPGGSFQYLWTFVQDGDSWLVKARTLPGMGG